MALVLDTATMPRPDRAEAVRSAMRYARVPALLTHEAEERVHARVDVWDLGGATTLLHRTSSGVRLRRTPRQVHRCAEDRFGLVLLSPGRWSFDQRREHRAVQTDRWDMLLVDHSAPYDFGRHGDGTTYAVNVDHTVLGLPLDMVRGAATRLPASPLYLLLKKHVLEVAGTIDAVAPGPATAMLGSATVDLIRAVILGAAAPQRDRPADDPAALLTQTKLYVQRHYAEPTLCATGVARAHAVSLRRLYSVWATAETSLAEHVMTVRLEAARTRLAVPISGLPTIAAVGRGCGFVDMGHFARRFRQAYGLSPSEWRRQNRGHPDAHPRTTSP